jgi:hypothetical protein
MDIAEAKTKLVELTAELAQNETEHKDLKKIYMEHRKKVNLCENKQKELLKEIEKLEKIIETENIFETVENIEGFDTLLQEELVAISNGMDRTNYRKICKESNYPRFKDLERLVKQVILFKKLYPGWILDSLKNVGRVDILPPETVYKYTFKTPQGHYWSHSGIESIR